MKFQNFQLLLILIINIININIINSCTTIVIGPKATHDGCVLTSQTADCANCAFNLAKVPASSHDPEEGRDIFQFHTYYPRMISNRSNTWKYDNLDNVPQKNEWKPEIIGQIDQVNYTYSLFESQYGMINEWQVAMGESTCAAKFNAASVAAGGKALVDIGELTRIALERCKTAKCAIKTMGSLAEKYGYYSADPTDSGEAGEAISVVDPKEAWIFHILPDDTGESAIWVAERVPDDHVSVVANQFVIRDIDPDKTYNGSPKFLYSDNIWDIAEKHNLWDPKEDELLDFTKTFSPTRAHATYATRRVWRVMSYFSPSSNLPINTNDYGDDYPFSIKVDFLAKPSDIMTLLRDHYEGTEVDLTKGMAGGPYGNPQRWDPAAGPESNDLTSEEAMGGNFERAISMFRTSYSYIAQVREDLPNEVGAMIWYAPYSAHSSVYVPIYLVVDDPPKEYMTGSLFQFREDSAFWLFAVVGNWASRFWEYIIEDIKDVQNELEDPMFSYQEEFEQYAASLIYQGKEDEAIELMQKYTSDRADEVLSTWKSFWYKLIAKYHDGARLVDPTAVVIDMEKLFYPKWWLEQVGYFTGTEYDTSTTTNELVEETNTDDDEYDGSFKSAASFYSTLIVLSVIIAAIFTVVGIMIGKNKYQRKGYYVIDL